ncbi:Transmembrane regulatory protein ToxS [Vibrio aerogenes CECT 7868]|uniref:Transmembrane regulatory protein ToxS n=1 Tax=Vibrio aerogenes CECT 7868 TaxID=1216006 RepID=A0A1M5Z138_9VIBR|nr:regulatory protein ToxS [Vibrio aerogenes]SHI17603.1 Transmembrane regulatory protein ToxS [Vibrio aerogenes CECT 7868]
MSLNKINLKVAAMILLVSSIFSIWLYWGSDLKLKQLLISREWQSKIVRLIEHANKESAVGPLRRVDVTSNVKYLPNGTYIRVSVVQLYANKSQPESTIDISESGEWKLSENYLLLSPTEFKDVSDSQSKDFTPEQLNLIKQFFKMDAQQSKRIDVINKNTLLLANLNHDSTILFTN